MTSVTSRKMYLFLFWTVLFLLQDRLQRWCTPVQYADELFALLIIPLFLFAVLQKKKRFVWTRKRVLFLVLLTVFWIFGWAGYFRYHYQPFANAAKDAYINLKFFMAVGASFLMFDDALLDFDQFKRRIWPVLNTITVILFVLCLADLFFGIFPVEPELAQSRGGIRSIKLFYSAYTFLVGQCVFLSAIYLWFFEQKKKQIIVPLAMLAFVMLSTQRVKAVGAIACILMIYLCVFYKRQKINKKVKILAGCVLGVAVLTGLYQLVSYYYLMGFESARAVLAIGAPFIAADHFPFGTGWATYGSAFSVEPYSPVYGMYRMAGIWGMSPDFHEFVSDTFWPMVLGECGYFGFAAFIGALVLFVKKVFTLKGNKSAFASALIPLLYLFISSSSESAFVNPIAIPLAFWIGFLFAEQRVRSHRSVNCEI